MPFERPSKPPEYQSQLEKLQRLSREEQAVLFQLAHRTGVTAREEVSTNFLSQLHPDHLTGLYQKWRKLDMKVREQGTDIAHLEESEIEAFLQEVIEQQQ